MVKVAQMVKEVEILILSNGKGGGVGGYESSRRNRGQNDSPFLGTPYTNAVSHLFLSFIIHLVPLRQTGCGSVQPRV